MQTDFDTLQKIANINDDTLVDQIFDDDIVAMLYDTGLFTDSAVDFGGGVYGITCRSLLFEVKGDPEILRQELKLRKNPQNSAMCFSIVQMCIDAINRSAYLS